MSEDVYSLLAVLDYYGINMDNIPSIKQDRLLTYAVSKCFILKSS